jgi:hypothetical protein
MKDSVNINGIEVGPGTDVTALLRNELLGGGRLAGRYDEEPEPGIRSLMQAANGTPLEGRILSALRSLSADVDPEVRSKAVGLVLHYAERFDPSVLLAMLEKNPTLYNDVPSSQDPQLDLTWTLLRAAAASPSKDQRVIARLREAVIDPVKGMWVLAGVTSHDADWVTEHAQEVISGQPARARIMLYRLKDPSQRERLVRSIPKESPQLRKAVADAISEEVKDPVERARLLSLLK